MINQRPTRPARDHSATLPPKTVGSKKRRRRQIRILSRLFVLMLALFCFSTLISAIFSGNAPRLAQRLGALLTPGPPRLVLQDARREHKIKPLNRSQAQDLASHLSTTYQENQGITALNAGNPAADDQPMDTMGKILSRLGYQPQTLQISQPLSQKIYFAKAPSQLNLFLYFDGAVSLSQSLAEVNSFAPAKDGLCYVVVEALWQKERAWQRDRSGLYCFAISFDRPPSFTVNATEIDPGELLVFYAEYLTETDTVAVQSMLPLNLQFAPYGDRQMIALAPLSYDIRPGIYSTTLTQGATSQTFDITVKDKEFAIQYVAVDPQLAADTRNEETNAEFQEKVTPILGEHLPRLLWRGQAEPPVPESQVLSLFGARRYINDDANSYRHTGLDLAAPPDTEVKAVNDGSVLFAEYLTYTGNTVIIEHGLGLKSWYYHLSELLVSTGDTVQKGDTIGLSGQTGFAAEPHLHLNLSVNDIFINPATALNAPLFDEPLP